MKILCVVQELAWEVRLSPEHWFSDGHDKKAALYQSDVCPVAAFPTQLYLHAQKKHKALAEMPGATMLAWHLVFSDITEIHQGVTIQGKQWEQRVGLIFKELGWRDVSV